MRDRKVLSIQLFAFGIRVESCFGVDCALQSYAGIWRTRDLFDGRLSRGLADSAFCIRDLNISEHYSLRSIE